MSHGDASPTTSATTPGRRAALRAGDGLVAAQGAALAGMAWPGPPRWRLPRAAAATAVGAVAAGGLLAVAAARAHGARLTPRVEPVPDATLLTPARAPRPAPPLGCDGDHSRDVGHHVLGRPSRASSG